jgi:hypothetical protein
MQHPHEHTWKSADAGDDVIEIAPHDPSFFPGMFYVSVFAMRDTAFELVCELIPQVTRHLQPPPSPLTAHPSPNTLHPADT